MRAISKASLGALFGLATVTLLGGSAAAGLPEDVNAGAVPELLKLSRQVRAARYPGNVLVAQPVRFKRHGAKLHTATTLYDAGNARMRRTVIVGSSMARGLD